MTTKQFFTKYDGKFIDYDGHFGNQCVDLYRQYVKEVLQIPQSPGVGGAADIWDTYLDRYFERVPNTPKAVPDLGDVIIWNRKLGNGYGHVAIFSHGDVNNFISFDQNWPVGSPCHFQDHKYSSIYGWLHPKGNMGQSPELKACLSMHTKLVNEARVDKQKIATLDSYIEALKLDAANMKNTHSDEIKKLNVDLSRLLTVETDLQKEKDARRTDALDWEKEKIKLEGDILKLKQRLASKDLSDHDWKKLFMALMRKVELHLRNYRKD